MGFYVLPKNCGTDTDCIYVPGKPGICFHYYCKVFDEYKYLDTFWLADRIRLFLQYTISLSSLCKLICRHWTYKMPVKIYFVECVSKIKHILSVIHYTICGAVCFQFTRFPCDDWENIYCVLLSSSNRKYVLFIAHCLGLGHETMVSAICLSIFLLKYSMVWDAVTLIWRHSYMGLSCKRLNT